MNYLTPIEQKRVIYSDGYSFPKRELTDIEKEISRVIVIYNIQVCTDGDVKVKNQAFEECFKRICELTGSSRLNDKLKAALGSPEKFDEFTEMYPYVKYGQIINSSDRSLSPVEHLAKNEFSVEDVLILIRWLGSLTLLVTELPKGADTFIWTPFSQWYNTREIAKRSGEPAYYGYALPAPLQGEVNVLFGNEEIGAEYRKGNSAWSLRHIIESGIHKTPEAWDRFQMGDISKEYQNQGLEISIHHVLVAFTQLSYLEVKQESTNTRLRFIIEG